MKVIKLLPAIALLSIVLITGCRQDESELASVTEIPFATDLNARTSQVSVPLIGASNFAVLAGTTVTNDGMSLIAGDVGVSPGIALTGFQPTSVNTIIGAGTVTAGQGVVHGIIYAGGAAAAQAHNDAIIAYDYLVGQSPDTTYYGVTQLDGRTFTPGIYRFARSANLRVNGTVYLDFQGNSDAVFVFLLGTTLVTMTGSKIVAINSNDQTCRGSNVYWTVGSAAIHGTRFIGTVIAKTTITMTSGVNLTGRILALNGAVTMVTNAISICSNVGTLPPNPCRNFITGGGWIKVRADIRNHITYQKGIFGISGGIKNDRFWGQLSFHDGERNGIRIKGTEVTAYTTLNPVTRQIEGTASINGEGSYAYQVVVTDNGESGKADSFSLKLSNGYTVSGVLKGGNIHLRNKCEESRADHDREEYVDMDESDGHATAIAEI
jgi:hypothetical protein